MATSNAIAIKRLQQEKELKLAELGQNYNLKLRELEIEREKLAETISNNLRVYKINLSKNQIDRIANNELNERESRKIVETIRHNLETELEAKRSNMTNENIKIVENNIKMLDTILTGAKPVGKDAASIAVSAAINQSMLKALGLPSVSQDIISEWKNWTKTPDHNTSKGIVQYTNDEGVVTKGILKGARITSKTGGNGASGGGRGGGARGTNFNEDEEEIVEDYTFVGPQERRVKTNETNVNQTQNTASSGSGTRGHQSKSESKSESSGTEGRESSGSKVIYSPGTKTGPGWFY